MVALTRSRAHPWVVGGAALAALYPAVFAIVGSAAFARAPGRIAIAATFDLTVTATLIVWRFGVRRRALPGWIAVATFSWWIAMARAWVRMRRSARWPPWAAPSRSSRWAGCWSGSGARERSQLMKRTA